MTQLRALHQSPTLLVPEKVLLPEGAQSGHAVFVEDGRIRAVGPLAEVAAIAEKQPVQPAVPARNSESSSDTRPAPARIDLPGRLLTPGFVDSHTTSRRPSANPSSSANPRRSSSGFGCRWSRTWTPKRSTLPPGSRPGNRCAAASPPSPTPAHVPASTSP